MSDTPGITELTVDTTVPAVVTTVLAIVDVRSPTAPTTATTGDKIVDNIEIGKMDVVGGMDEVGEMDVGEEDVEIVVTIDVFNTVVGTTVAVYTTSKGNSL